MFKDFRFKELFYLVFLSALVWASRFYYSSQFGIYEDDQYRVPRGMEWTWDYFYQYLIELPQQIVLIGHQGRPLHTGFIQIFSFLGNQLGGFHGIYVIGYCIVLANTLLFYALLRRLVANPFFAVVGAIAFALFPADTTQSFLTHTLGVQPALGMVLVSFHLYISSFRGAKFGAYFLALISLFCYEKFFLVLIAAPLLKSDWTKNTRLMLVKHTSILFGILAAVAFARRLAGEKRVSDLNVSAFLKIITDTITGPFIGLATYLYRPFTGLFALQIDWILPLLLFFAALVIVLHTVKLTDSVKPSGLTEDSQSTTARRSFRELYHWVRVSVVMIVLSYPLTLIGDVYVVSGRGTRVHAAAVIGGSILCACLGSAIAILSARKAKRHFVTAGLATFFTLLLAFGFTIQQDFVKSRQYQRAFWTDFIELSADMNRGTIILVQDDVIRELHYIDSTPYVEQIFARIYEFPEAWGRLRSRKDLFRRIRRVTQPVIYQLKEDWQDHLLAKNSDGNVIQLTEEAIHYDRLAKADPEIDSTQTIVLTVENGKLTRQTEPISVDGKAFPLKQNDLKHSRPPFKPGVLYRYLIEEPNQPSVDYIGSEA